MGNCGTDKDLAIGVLDSGMGGLTMLSALKARLPRENFIYCGDNVNAPYGRYAEGKIRELALCRAGELYAAGIKALLLACNTVTAAAAAAIRAESPVPVIGMEPAVKPAAVYTKTGKVLVLATDATLKNKNYTQSARGGVEILPCPCKNLAGAIEKNFFDDAYLRLYIEDILSPYAAAGADCLVLGCTHYVLKKRLFRDICGEGSALFDGTDGTCANLIARLSAENLLRERGEGECRLRLTAPSPRALAAYYAVFPYF
jgi:glutamate racemase